MKTHTPKILFSIFALSTLCSFVAKHRNTEYENLQKQELMVLRKNNIGKIYEYDLTGKKECNKTALKYLGKIKTKKGRQYKILTSFFVFSTTNDMCRGISHIKIYDLNNRYIGKYNVGMPYNLPESLKNNRLLYLNNVQQCNERKERNINLSNGLPKSFFLECKDGLGDEYTFSQ